MFSTTKKVGILGGGQLGKMLCIAAAPLDIKTWILEADIHCPAASVCSGLVKGDFKSYEDVLAFGKDMDIITIEIEHVNTEALKELEKAGKIIHPSPHALEIIKDKGLQKQFYAEQGIPTMPFSLFADENAVRKAVELGNLTLPFVQKTRTAGYDGKGVAVIRDIADLQSKLLPGACVVESLADIEMEIAVIVARNANDEVAVFPAVEMEFHPEANLVEFLVCPARISPLIAAEAETLAETIIRKLGICGVLAVEMFLTTDGDLIINEVAPRPHNSGHHTINSAVTDQFQQHLRAICNLPLGNTNQIRPAVMINVLGEPGYKGTVTYEGAERVFALPEVYLHLYGKTTTSPFRKMGHITVTATNLPDAIAKAKEVKSFFRVIAE